MLYAAALLLLPCRAPCEVGGRVGTAREGRGGQQERGPRLDGRGPFPSLWWRLTSFRGLQGQRCGSGCRTPGLERKEAGPEGEAGMGARAGPEAEIHGSGSETGEVVKDPERPSGSKPGREEKAVWEGGSGGLRHPTPPHPTPVWGSRTRERNPSGGSWVPRHLDLWAEVLEAQTFPFSRKAGILSAVPKGCGG